MFLTGQLGRFLSGNLMKFAVIGLTRDGDESGPPVWSDPPGTVPGPDLDRASAGLGSLWMTLSLPMPFWSVSGEPGQNRRGGGSLHALQQHICQVGPESPIRRRVDDRTMRSQTCDAFSSHIFLRSSKLQVIKNKEIRSV